MNNNLAIRDDSLDGRIQEYEDLLLRRDQILKECDSIVIAYTKEYGELTQRSFELKIDCIKNKKSIAYCQKQINRGLNIDSETMNAMIEREMAVYYDELHEIMERNSMARDAETINEYRLQRAKKIYRRLAKKLHPDINAQTAENGVLRDLWVKIAFAYRMSDIEALEDLEAMVRKVMEELGEEGFEYDTSNLGERIERLEAQIADILATEPYTYREILRDDEKRAAKKKALEDEIAEYEKYLAELTATLDKLLSHKGVNIIWKMPSK